MNQEEYDGIYQSHFDGSWRYVDEAGFESGPYMAKEKAIKGRERYARFLNGNMKLTDHWLVAWWSLKYLIRREYRKLFK